MIRSGPTRCSPLIRLVLTAFTLLPISTWAANVTVERSRNGGAVAALDVQVECDGQQLWAGPLLPEDSLVVSLEQNGLPADFCRVSSAPVPGRELVYRSDGGSESDSSAQGCEYRNIRPGDRNYCLVRLEDELTEVRVYTRWIGADGNELPVEAKLTCAGLLEQEPIWIDQKEAGGWQLTDVPPDGIRCSIRETRRDDFIADMSDCRNLRVMPGTREECTLVNTKVVKRIEMLNRYGKVIMVAVFLMVGLLAARRFA